MKKTLVLLVCGGLAVLLCGFKMKEQAENFRTYYPSGALQAEFPKKQGRLEGETVWYYESGAIGAVLHYKNNRLHGPARTYYEDGKLKKEIQHENNQPVGKAKYYDREGALLYEDFYEPGKPVLRTHYSRDGGMASCEEVPRAAGAYRIME